MKKRVGKILKWAGISLLSLFLLLVIFVYSLNLPGVQNLVKNQVVNYIQNKIKTPVSLERVFVDFPNKLTLEKLLIKDQRKDTMLYIQELKVGLSIPELLKNKADITSIYLHTATANVRRESNGTFNFDYIINAFAGNKKEEKTDAKPFELSLNDIDLHKLTVRFNDLQAKNDLQVYFNSFKTNVKTFNPELNTYAFGDILSDGLRLTMKQDIFKEVAKNVTGKVDSLSQKKPFQLGLQKIVLKDYRIQYDDLNSKTFANIIVGELSTDIGKLDLPKNTFDVKSFSIKNSDIRASVFNPAKTNELAKELPDNPTHSKGPLVAALQKFNLENVKVSYENTGYGKKDGFDTNHLNFSTLNLSGENISIKDSEYTGEINSGYIREASGLAIDEAKFDFAYQEKQAYLKKLYLKTPNTLLQDEISLGYNSQIELSKNPENVALFVNLRQSKIAIKDIFLFAPQLKSNPSLAQYRNSSLFLDTQLRGKLNDIIINRLYAYGLGNLRINANGRIINASDPNTLQYDLVIRELKAKKSDVLAFIPPKSLPKNINLPDWMDVRGTAKGSTQVFNANLAIQTSAGNAKINATANLARKGSETYDIKSDFRQFNIGYILKNKDLGLITGIINAKGVGFDPKTANVIANGNLQRFDYQSYSYNNVVLKAKLNRGSYVANINSQDTNARLNMALAGNLNQSQSLKANGNIGYIDLNKLGYTKEIVRLSGDIAANFTSINPDALNGSLFLKTFTYSDGKQKIPLQEFSLIASSTSSENSIKIRSQIIDADIDGKYKLTQIAPALLSTLDYYYHIPSVTSSKNLSSGQHFAFNAVVKDDPLLKAFLPELKFFQNASIIGNFNADNRKLNVKANVPELEYGDYKVSNLNLTIANPGNVLEYSLFAQNVNSEKLAIKELKLGGDIANNKIGIIASSKDKDGVDQFMLAGDVRSEKNMNFLSLRPGGVKINYEDWVVNENNTLGFGKPGIYADNFVLSKNTSSIGLQSQTKRPGSPLEVKINNFKIEDITEMLKKDTLLASGTVNGTALVKSFSPNIAAEAVIKVSDLKMYNNPVGNIDITANTVSKDLMNAKVSLSGNGNDAEIRGTYGISGGSLDMIADIKALQMTTVQGFALGAIFSAEGSLGGKLTINGTTASPKVNGNLGFRNAGLEITKTGSVFKNINDEIIFQNQDVVFDKFKLKDADGNALVLDGRIKSQNFSSFAFDLNLTAQDFKLVDSKKDNDKLMYGVLAMNADLKIRGDFDLPKVDGSLSITDKTDFTFVLPQRSPTLQEREGIVEFTEEELFGKNTTAVTDTLQVNNKVKGMDVSVNIDLNREAKISLIIDKANGDFVKLQGEAKLTGGIDPSGKTTLVGVYEIEQGSYELSVNVLKRKFDIKKGSTITWNGEPTNADLDVTAIYEVETAPLDLVQQQIASSTPGQLAPFKQRIPFQTLLQMRGELLKPEILFDITTEDKNAAVSAEVLSLTRTKLEQLRQEPSEMNKQVFALLLLGRFIGENPFESSTGMSAESMARASVSRILSQSLNDLAGGLIAGLDINFGIESEDDYSMGEKNTRTDLNVGLSKRLLNDRLKVSVGSNFGLEGKARTGEQTSNIAGDIMIDYQLSKDGKYMMRAYRKNQYQVALQGQIIETGLGFVITLDYNDFRDLLKKNKSAIKKKELTEGTVLPNDGKTRK